MKRFKAVQACLAFMMLILSVFLITGCGSNGQTGHWLPDNPPWVTEISPLDGAANVPISTRIITTTFNEAMDPATLTTASFTLVCPGYSSGTAPVVTYLAADNQATLTLPSTPDLPPGTSCTATVTTVATDSAGTPLANDFVWTFTTLPLPPHVVFTVPANSAIVAPANTAITARFDKDMASGTIIAANFIVVDNAAPTVHLTGDVTYVAASKTALFKPDSNLIVGHTYTATITSAATDTTDNHLAVPDVSGLSVPNPWTFTATAVESVHPTVTLTDPANSTTGVVISSSVKATFSEAMDPSTISTATFTLTKTATPGTLITGTVTYNSVTNIATFKPSISLDANTDYTATITTVATNLAGIHLVEPVVGPPPNPWTFKTAATAGTHLGPLPVDLGSAGTFRVLAGSAITNTDVVGDPTTIDGNVGVSPGSTVNGLTEPNNIVSGFHIYAGGPIALAAKLDLLDAYNDAQSRSTDAISLPGQLGGLTLAPGLYVNSTSSGISGTGSNAILTLDGQGDSTAVWIFKLGSTLITDPYTSIVCINGCHAENVFWQVGSSATLGVGSIFYGTIMSDAAITINTHAVLHGRALTRSAAATLDKNQLVP
jgi:hypothetical protein